MRLRHRIAPFLDGFGVLDLAAAVTKPLARKRFTILMYHRISVPGAHAILADRTISTTPDEFEEQMAWLARFTHPIGFRDLWESEKTGKPLPPRSVIVTFDDGYLDNYLCAFPILRSHRIPATIFLVTGLVGTTGMFWWDSVRAALRQKNKSDEEVKKEVERLKRLPEAEWKKHIGAIVGQAGLSVSEGPRTIVSWEEVREMSEEGIDFGGHTVTHPILSKLPPVTLDEEIRGCKVALARELGREPLAFAYPVGRKFALSEDAARAVERAGFRYAVTTEFGRNESSSVNRYHLLRIGVGLEDFPARFKAKFLAPGFFRPSDSLAHQE